jgi:hypothetical protein
MPRRSGARPLIAPPASLALVSSILIALAALVPAGAAASSETSTSSSEAAVLAAPAEPALSKAAQREAEREVRRAAREAAQAEAQAAAAAAAAARQAERDAKKVEHAAEREARKSSSATGAAAPASTHAAAQTAAGEKAHRTHAEVVTERELAAEQRRREKEAKTGRAVHENKKQIEMRVARERAAKGREQGGAGGELEKALGGSGGRQGSAAGGVASGQGGSAVVQPSSAGAVASARTGRKGSGASAHGQGRGRHSSGGSTAAAGAGALALGTGAALGSGSGAGTGEGGSSGPGHSGQKAHHTGSGKGESTIVRTVTQIVGVIPTALWLLIGLLGLAAAAFAVTSRMTARRARRLDGQRRALLEDVGLLQAALLPELPERLGPVGTTAAYRPASGPGAGGDFYDVFALPEGLLAVIVGDVSGHGREALPHTTLLRYTLRAYMEAGLSPREALRAAAPSLERQLGGSFATVVLASWDPRARRLTYACAGHPHPIVTGLDPSASIIAASAPPIGAGNATGSRQTVMTIPGAGTACFYTDGVIEARSSGELYGSTRLASALTALRAEHAGTGPEAAELLDRVAAETERRPDDMAACVLELAGDEEEPRILREELLLDARDAAGKRARRFLEAAGVAEPELGASLDRARTIAAEHGSALLEVDLGGERPRVSVLQDNIAPLRARALARTQEVAL